MEQTFNINQVTIPSFRSCRENNGSTKNKAQARGAHISFGEQDEGKIVQSQLPLCRTVHPNKNEGHVFPEKIEQKAQAFATLILEVVYGQRPVQEVKAISTGSAYSKIDQLAYIMRGSQAVRRHQRHRTAKVIAINSQWLNDKTVEVSVVGCVQNKYRAVAIRLEKKRHASYHLSATSRTTWKAAAVEIG